MLHLNWHELEKEEESQSTFFENGSAVSIGSFDGLHKGHCALLKRLMEQGKNLALPCGVVTFASPPRYLFHSLPPSCISTLRLKRENLEKLGLDFVILVDFSLDFAKMTGDSFVELLKKYINLKYLLVGEDFRFGRKRSSSIEDILELSFKFSFSFEAFSNLCGEEGEHKISSSFIREAIYEGDIKEISNLLQDGVSVDLLGAKPLCMGKRKLGFSKEDLQQVLPKEGEFLGGVRLCDGSEQEVRVLIDSKCVKLFFDECEGCGSNSGEFGEEFPHFDILKLKEKI